MKFSFSPLVFTFSLLLSLALPLAAQAEIVNWNTPGTPGQTDPWGNTNSLFPTSGTSGNTVNVTANVTGNSIDGGIFGGIDYQGAQGSTVTASNTVNITGSTVDAEFLVHGGHSYVDQADGTATATGNSVYITNSIIMGSEVLGGGGFVSSIGETLVSGNTVSIINSTAGSARVYGGVCEVNTGDATTDDNTVYVSGSTVYAISGGSSKIGGGNGTAKANSNTVTIVDSSVTGDLHGGYITTAVYTGNTAINNTVTLQGTTDIGGNLAGGDMAGTIVSDVFTGNTLNVKSPKAGGITVGGDLKNFQFLNFYAPTSMVNGGIMLDVTGTADISGSTVNVGIEGGSSPLQVGNTLTLIKAGTLTGAPINSSTSAQGMQGISLLYDFILSQDSDNLYATVAVAGTNPIGPEPDPGPDPGPGPVPGDPARVNPRTKSLAEGRAGGMAFVTQGADLAAGQGMSSALAVTSGSGGGGVAGFGAISGGSMRYNTGSHADVNGFSLMTGLGWRAPLLHNSLLLGAFFEAGWGNYNSQNSFSNAASVKGDGDTSYYGGGILARYDLTDGQIARLYMETSLRAGHVSTDFSSSDLRDVNGQNASYDSGAAYYGAHAGLGYVWQLNDAASLDFSTKYLWTHQNSDSVTVVGDPVHFKASDSQRWRNGARFNYAVSTESGAQFTPYLGAAWEYEFDAEARATTYGRDIDSPSLKGGTGMGELGVSFKPVAISAFSADLGAQGYTGKREGVTGSLQLKYEF